MSKEREEGLELQLDFDKLAKAAASSSGILPVAVQDADTQAVILVAYSNELAFRKSLELREVVLWSTSRNFRTALARSARDTRRQNIEPLIAASTASSTDCSENENRPRTSLRSPGFTPTM